MDVTIQAIHWKHWRLAEYADFLLYRWARAIRHLVIRSYVVIYWFWSPPDIYLSLPQYM